MIISSTSINGESMKHEQQYKENYGIQSRWMDTHEAKPYKIKKKYFIDVNQQTVARGDSMKDIKDLLKYYPQGEIRVYNPTQEEYIFELALNKELVLNNWGIIGQ